MKGTEFLSQTLNFSIWWYTLWISQTLIMWSKKKVSSSKYQRHWIFGLENQSCKNLVPLIHFYAYWN